MSQSDIINSRQIQWFPGHMTKTLRLMEKEIRNVDCVLQILDARIPLSSLNPEIERITAGKPHLYVLNKADLADPEITKQWLAYFTSAGAGCIAMDSKQRGRATATKSLIEKELSALMERRRNRGMVGAAIRVMIVGIPNVGKSTFINSFAGTTRAKAANKPGVTRGKQWISVGNFRRASQLMISNVLFTACCGKNSTRWKRHRIWHSSAPSAMTFWILRSWPAACFPACGASIPPSCWPGISWRSRRLRCRLTTFCRPSAPSAVC